MKIHGKNGIVKINGTTYANAATWAITVDRQFADISVFSDPGVVITAGLPSLSGSFEGLYNPSGDAAATYGGFTNQLVAIEVWASPSYMVASGNGYLQVSVNSSVNDAVRVNGSFRSSGAWTVQ